MGDEAMKCKTCGTEHRGIPKHGGYCLDHQEQRAEAAELRAAELEVLAEQRLNEIIRLKQERAAAELNTSGSAQTIVTLKKERDEARLELQRIRTMLDDGTHGENDTALDVVKRLQSHDYALQREAWYSRM